MEPRIQLLNPPAGGETPARRRRLLAGFATGGDFWDARQVHLFIRRAVSSHAEAVARLYLRARHAGAAAGTIPPLVHDDDDVRRWVAGVVIPSLECWVAERGSEIVGMLVLEADWIDQLYVAPGLTGAGIGAQLIALAKRERPDGLRLWSFVTNEGAQRFYVRHGFRELERTDGRGNEERTPDIQYVWVPA